MEARLLLRRPAALLVALGVLAFLLLSAGCSRAATRARNADASAPATLALGSQTLIRCATAPLAYCGSLPVPLDYRSPASPKIAIAFRWYPSTAAPPVPGAAGGSRSLHTVVPVEGGPGYPSIESVSYRSLGENAGYSAMYGKLLEHWNLLAVDNRGTGESAPLRCSALQRFAGPTGDGSVPPGRGGLRGGAQPPLEVRRRRRGARFADVRLDPGGTRSRGGDQGT